MTKPAFTSDASPTFGREKSVAILASFLGLAGGQPSVLFATATVFVLPLTARFGWGRTVPSLMYVAALLGVAVASVWIGRFIERWGAPRTVLTCSTLLTAALVMFGLQNGSILVALALSFVAGLFGAGTSLGVYLTILPKWFDARLGRALGFSIVGISAGSILMPLVAAKTEAAYGWSNAYFAVAAVHLAITMVVVTLLYWLTRKEVGLSQSPANQHNLVGETLAVAMATRTFWVLCAMIFLAAMGVFGIMLHLFPLYIDRGVISSMLPLIMVGVGAGTLLGRIISGIMLDKADAKWVAIAVFVSGAIGISWLAFEGPGFTPLTVLGPAFLIGVALGAESDIIPFMVRRIYGMRHYPVIYNRVLTSHYLGAITGTMLFGWVQDNLSDSRFAIAGLGGGCLVASVLALALPSTRLRT